VSSEPGKGTVVASLSKQEAMDIYDIRAQLEGLACRLFAKNASAADVDILIGTVDRLRSTIDDPAAMLQAKVDFYDALFTGARNSELPRILEGLRRRITLLRVSSLSAPGRPPESLKEIEAIRDALVNRDGPRAEELCRQHIDAAATAILTAPGAQFRDS
jgi:DNA-binding GntR family transcriptional regulator